MPIRQVDVAQKGISFFSLRKNETRTDILSFSKCFILCKAKKTFCTECTRMFKLKRFHQKMLWQGVQSMGQDWGLGQLYDAHF